MTATRKHDERMKEARCRMNEHFVISGNRRNIAKWFL
jgi:hypothetical protein